VATIEAVAELADGGFWYHVAVEETALGSKVLTHPVVPDVGDGWTARYLADGTAVVRCPSPILGVDTLSLSSADKLIAAGEATRPLGRIRGR
jgi:hypothetical protein